MCTLKELLQSGQKRLHMIIIVPIAAATSDRSWNEIVWIGKTFSSYLKSRSEREKNHHAHAQTEETHRFRQSESWKKTRIKTCLTTTTTGSPRIAYEKSCCLSDGLRANPMTNEPNTVPIPAPRQEYMNDRSTNISYQIRRHRPLLHLHRYILRHCQYRD